ncbi:con-10 [Penicillium sp. DV-2018c]|nr:con-10 [Penicillium sp. DV-2018c]
MVDNPNPGNFHNRPHEEVQNIARKGGQSSHKGGFASMDREKQRNIASKGGHASGGRFERGAERTKEAGRRGGHARSRSREGTSGYQEQGVVGDTQEPVEVEETEEFAEEPEEEYVE